MKSTFCYHLTLISTITAQMQVLKGTEKLFKEPLVLDPNHYLIK